MFRLQAEKNHPIKVINYGQYQRQKQGKNNSNTTIPQLSEANKRRAEQLTKLALQSKSNDNGRKINYIV